MTADSAVVIVACDCMTPLGMSLDESWLRLCAGESGIGRIDRFDPSGEALRGVASVQYGAQLPCALDALAGSSNLFQKSPEPIFHCISALCRNALSSIRFNASDHDSQRFALLGATAMGSHMSSWSLHQRGTPFANYILNQCQNVPLALAARDLGIRGPAFSINGACASGGQAAYVAYQLIKSGVIDLALVVGHEFPLTPEIAAGFEWINAVYKRERKEDRAYSNPQLASRPMSRDRRGFVLAESVGAVLLARADYAERFDWPALATLIGGTLNSDGDHLTRASPENVAACIKSALASSACLPEQVSSISAHATSTPTGDAAEVHALREVFGEHLSRIPLTAHKSQIGHSLGAACVLQIALATTAIARQVALPTINYDPDPELPSCRILSSAAAWQNDFILINSFGFGGTNCSLILGSAHRSHRGRHEQSEYGATTPSRP